MFKGKTINSEITKHDAAFDKAVDYYKQNKGFTKNKLIQKYKQFLNPGAGEFNDKKTVGFLEFFEQRKLEYKELGQVKWKNYGTTLNLLKEYFKKQKPSFDDIDSKFYVSFNKFLLSKNLAKNTISNQWKYIKAIMNVGRTLKLHSNTDYKEFVRSREEADTIYLTEEELNAIYNLKLKGTMALVRDYFLIGCYTGLRYSDWDKVNTSLIVDNMIKIRSSKTGQVSLIPIHKRVKDILKKYNGTLPTKPTNQTMNKHLKSIGMRAKINAPITQRKTVGGKIVESTQKKFMLIGTHTARRSFATILVLSGANPYSIMRITGHKTLSSFEKYIRIDELNASDELKGLDFFK